MLPVRALPIRRASRARAGACWLLTALACGGIAQEGSPRNDDPFSTFEPQQPGRRGGGRRGGGGAPPPFAGSPAPTPAASGESSVRPRPPRQPVAPPASAPEPSAVADAGSPSCDAGSCGSLTCEPGALRCTGAVLEECSSDRQTWLPGQVCATSCLCELGLANGACAAAACTAGEVRCVDSLLQRCSACQSGFEDVADCGTAEACNATTLSCDGESSEPTESAEPDEVTPDEQGASADAGAL